MLRADDRWERIPLDSLPVAKLRLARTFGLLCLHQILRDQNLTGQKSLWCQSTNYLLRHRSGWSLAHEVCHKSQESLESDWCVVDCQNQTCNSAPDHLWIQPDNDLAYQNFQVNLKILNMACLPFTEPKSMFMCSRWSIKKGKSSCISKLLCVGPMWKLSSPHLRHDMLIRKFHAPKKILPANLFWYSLGQKGRLSLYFNLENTWINSFAR